MVSAVPYLVMWYQSACKDKYFFADSDAAGKSPYCGAYNTLILMSTIIVMLEFVYPTLL